jgi:hypothetical protein
MFARDTQLLQKRNRMLHRFPIRSTPHDDTNESGIASFLRHNRRLPFFLKGSNCNGLFLIDSQFGPIKVGVARH